MRADSEMDLKMALDKPFLKDRWMSDWLVHSLTCILEVGVLDQIIEKVETGLMSAPSHSGDIEMLIREGVGEVMSTLDS